MFNNCHTRFGVIIFNTFEACVLLLTLCAHADFLIDHNDNSGQIVGLQTGRLTRKRLMQATEKGLSRLQTLSEVSDMAAAGARSVTELFANASKNAKVTPVAGFDDDLGFSPSSDPLRSSWVNESL